MQHFHSTARFKPYSRVRVNRATSPTKTASCRTLSTLRAHLLSSFIFILPEPPHQFRNVNNSPIPRGSCATDGNDGLHTDLLDQHLPSDSPRPSSSSTSLSSLASNDLPLAPKLVDTLGNPFELPDYTVDQIRKAIPPHCFERSAVRGLGYVARDVLSLATVFYLANRFITPENVPSTAARAGLWAAYTFVQGLFATGLWVLAHECGHQSFSPSKTLNDTVGFICHSALLVPYFSWKISHGKHHKATGNLERDMVFVPATRETFASGYGKLVHEIHELTEETPIASVLHLIRQQLGGWPAYLLTNVTGHNFHERQSEGRGKGKKNGLGNGVNHFNPSSPLFEAKDAKLIALSDVGLLATLSALFWVGKNYGMANLFVWYILPYLWVNHWLGKFFVPLDLKF